MEKTKEWLKTCLNKRVYKTRDFADRAAKFASKEFKTPMYVYSCKHCQHFHLTKHAPRGTK